MVTLIPLFEDRSHSMVNQIMNGALSCPKCHATKHDLIAMTEAKVKSPCYLVACTRCKFKGSFGRGLEDAVLRWNKPPGFLARMFQKTRRP